MKGKTIQYESRSFQLLSQTYYRQNPIKIMIKHMYHKEYATKLVRGY